MNRALETVWCHVKNAEQSYREELDKGRDLADVYEESLMLDEVEDSNPSAYELVGAVLDDIDWGTLVRRLRMEM